MHEVVHAFMHEGIGPNFKGLVYSVNPQLIRKMVPIKWCEVPSLVKTVATSMLDVFSARSGQHVLVCHVGKVPCTTFFAVIGGLLKLECHGRRLSSHQNAVWWGDIETCEASNEVTARLVDRWEAVEKVNSKDACKGNSKLQQPRRDNRSQLLLCWRAIDDRRLDKCTHQVET